MPSRPEAAFRFSLLGRQCLCYGWLSLGIEQHHLCREALEMGNLDRLDSRILDDLPARSLPVHFLLRTKLGVERCCSHHRLLLRNLRILVGSIHWLLLMQQLIRDQSFKQPAINLWPALIFSLSISIVATGIPSAAPGMQRPIKDWLPGQSIQIT